VGRLIGIGILKLCTMPIPFVLLWNLRVSARGSVISNIELAESVGRLAVRRHPSAKVLSVA
jgi:hypothetical protein